MMASTSKNLKPMRKGKSITMSLGDNLNENICVQMPKVNLNNTTIDLTSSPDVSDYENSQGRKKVSKTLHLDMELSSSGTSTSSRVLRSQTESNRPSKRFTLIQQQNFPNVSVVNEPKQSHCVMPRRISLRQSIDQPCYQKLQEIMQKPLIENYDDFNCVLCNKLIKRGQGVVLKECVHTFCRPCLIDVIKRSGKIRVDCPNVPDICESFISIDEIRAILGDENFEAFTNKMSDDSAEALLPILLNMDDLAVIPNINAFTCQVCYAEIDVGEGIILKNCLHNGCKECLSQLIGHAEQFEVQCPYVENNFACREFIQEQEMRFVTTEEVFDKHLKKSLKIAEHVNEMNFHCRAVDCDCFVELAEGMTDFICPACNVKNCVICKTVDHPGKTHIENQEDLYPELKDARLKGENKQSEETINAEIAAGTAMRCPRCQIPLNKITGCDNITCTACKLNICWVTKKPRKAFKRANGEIVDGCHCREPPEMKRCHPKCGNCH